MAGTSDGGQWAPDPSGAHEFRWREQTAWTGWVSDRGSTTFAPIGSAPDKRPAQAFSDRRHALNRLVAGLVAIVAGAGVTALTLFTSEPSPIFIIFYGPVIWGVLEGARAAKYLLTEAQPSAVPRTEPPPPVDFAAEVNILDELFRRGKLTAHTRDLAMIKLRRKYGGSVE
jgi:hypothetical protein